MTANTFQFLGALRHNVQHYEGELGALKPRYTPTHSPAQTAPAQSAPGSEVGSAAAVGAGSATSEAGGSSSTMPAHPAFNTVHDTLHHGPPTTPLLRADHGTL